MRLILVIFLLGICGCTDVSVDNEKSNVITEKITFDVSRLDSDGLIGKAGGKRSLSYEFCVPNTDKCRKEVKAIDPSVELSKSRGRIGCSESQWLCIGSTHQAGFMEVLANLCALDYIDRIDECFFE